MIKTNINESFLITSTIVDEEQGIAVSGETVYYDIRRQPGDVLLSPAKYGTFTESTVESGIYYAVESINTAGNYLIYATCSGFLPAIEEVLVEQENIYDIVKQVRHYNTAVENVIRESIIPSASQVARNVGLDKTDYVITKIKPNNVADWTDPATVSGIVYAHYRNLDDEVPYKMEGPY